jgi:hypothetical protein
MKQGLRSPDLAPAGEVAASFSALRRNEIRQV